MAAPYPPQGNQSQHTERPLKIYAEQLIAGAEVPVGVDMTINPGYPNGEPRVYAGAVVYPIAVTDWVISNRYTGQPIDVISAEEFTERFGPSE